MKDTCCCQEAVFVSIWSDVDVSVSVVSNIRECYPKWPISTVKSSLSARLNYFLADLTPSLCSLQQTVNHSRSVDKRETLKPTAHIFYMKYISNHFDLKVFNCNLEFYLRHREEKKQTYGWSTTLATTPVMQLLNIVGYTVVPLEKPLLIRLWGRNTHFPTTISTDTGYLQKFPSLFPKRERTLRWSQIRSNFFSYQIPR